MFTPRTEEEFLNEQLTPHFKRSEFACKCGGKYCSPRWANISPQIVEICEVIREYVGHPIRVSSGCRCPKWNEKQGGVANSEHEVGAAADLHCDAIGSEKLFKAIQELYKAGKIPNLRYCQRYIKKDFCHCDCSSSKKRKNVFATVA